MWQKVWLTQTYWQHWLYQGILKFLPIYLVHWFHSSESSNFLYIGHKHSLWYLNINILFTHKYFISGGNISNIIF
jgi:hypothetical protein